MNVGAGVLASMEATGDAPIRDSDWPAWGEVGYGTSGRTYIYLKSTNAVEVWPFEAPAPAPDPIVHAIDVSNYNGDLADEFAAHPEAELVVVRIGLKCEPPSLRDIARAQVQQSVEAGKRVAFYVWGYRSYDPQSTRGEALDFMVSLPQPDMPMLWLDCETYTDRRGNVLDPGPDAVWIRAFLAGLTRVGIYTGRWWIEGYFPGGEGAFSEFSDRRLWLAQYDDDPNLDTVILPQGFTSAAGKQYSGDPVDLNVFRREFT